VHLARGEDERDVDPEAAARSIGAEMTYEEDLVGSGAIARTLLEHARKVARRMVSADVSARIVVVKVKYADFSLRTRRVTLPEPVQDTDSLHQAAVRLLDRFPLQDRRVRLTGLSVGGIVGGGPPRLLVPDGADRRTRLERVTADIVKRFDDRAVTRATLIDKGR
jgi:DNA polymerase-4